MKTLLCSAAFTLLVGCSARAGLPAYSTIPDFTLTDQNGNKVSLHDFKGKKNVALAFYVFAFTGG